MIIHFEDIDYHSDLSLNVLKFQDFLIMKVSEFDYADQFFVFNFLKKIAETVKGDVRKKVKLRKIWMEMEVDATNSLVIELTFKDKILPILVQEKLIGWDEKEGLSISYEGIYRVSEHYMVSPETFGILSRNDLEKYSQSLLNLLYELTLNTDLVSLNNLKKRYHHSLGEIPLIQMIDSLDQQELIVKRETKGDYTISLPEKTR